MYGKIICFKGNSWQNDKIVALAAVAAASAASAQVTLSGNFALNYDSTLGGVEEAYADDARLKFAVSEDLGGGLKLSADAMIEANGGRNTSTANQGWTVALSGTFGTLTAKNYLSGASTLSAGISASQEMEHVAGGYASRNRLQYVAPEMVKGLGLTLTWDATGGRNAAASAADYTAPKIDMTLPNTKWDISYATGPVAVTLSGDTDSNFTDATVEYDAGFAKFALWADESGDDMEATVVAPVTNALSVGAMVLQYDNAEAWGFRATYALSKKTAVSFNYMDIDKNAMTAANVGTNYRVKLNHSF